MTKLIGSFLSFFKIANALKRYHAQTGNVCATLALALVPPLKVFQFIPS